MTRQQESEIIVRIKSGDVNAYEALVLDNQNRVYSLALRMTGNADDAQDLSQEAFIKAYTSLDKFKGLSSFSTWIYTIAANLCRDFLRKSKKGEITSITYISEDNTSEDIDIPDIRPDPQDELERAELRRYIADGLLTLSVDHRQIIIMRDINGMSYDEIAAALNISIGTVKSRIARGRLKLAAFISQYGTFPQNTASHNGKDGEMFE